MRALRNPVRFTRFKNDMRDILKTPMCYVVNRSSPLVSVYIYKEGNISVKNLLIFLSSKTSHPTPYSVGTRLLSQGYSGGGVKLSTCLHLVLKLRVNGAIPPVALYAFMMWRGTAFFYCIVITQDWGRQTDVWREAEIAWPNIIRTTDSYCTTVCSGSRCVLRL
jgi:hypothetical protein